MRTRTKLVIAAGVLIASLTGYNLFVAHSDQATEALHEQAVLHGWNPDDLMLVGGGYETALFSWTAFGHLRSKDERKPGDIYIRVRKPMPFAGWTLAEYRVE